MPYFLSGWESDHVESPLKPPTMAPRKRQAAVLPLRLGTVSNFDRSSFPLLKAKGPLKEGTFFLELTLDEILQIREMSQGRNDYDRVFQNAKDRYDEYVGYLVYASCHAEAVKLGA